MTWISFDISAKNTIITQSSWTYVIVFYCPLYPQEKILNNTDYKRTLIYLSVHCNANDRLANETTVMLFGHGITRVIDFPTT